MQPPDPAGSIRTRPRRRAGAVIRACAFTLLITWIGPVTDSQTGALRLMQRAGAASDASAATSQIPAGQAITLLPDTPIQIRLKSGRTVDGVFVGRSLLDSTTYAARFAQHARTSAFVPFALGESLHVVLSDGRHWTAPLVGYGEASLLLRAADGSEPLRVPFEMADSVRGADGESVAPLALLHAFRLGQLPSAEVLAIEEAGARGITEGAVRDRLVPVEDIATVRASAPGSSAGAIVGAVILGVLVGSVLLLLLLAYSLRDCGTNSIQFPHLESLRSSLLTTRAFDRERSCYVDQVLPAVDVRFGLVPEMAGSPPGTSLATAIGLR